LNLKLKKEEDIIIIIIIKIIIIRIIIIMVKAESMEARVIHFKTIMLRKNNNPQ